MFIAGIKFGIGMWLATIAVIALAMMLGSFVSYIRDCFKRRRRRTDVPKLHRATRAYLLWTRRPEFARQEEGPCRSYSFRTTIRWGYENPRDPRKEPHYRY